MRLITKLAENCFLFNDFSLLEYGNRNQLSVHIERMICDIACL